MDGDSVIKRAFFTRRTMRRVYLAYLLRMLTRPIALKVFILCSVFAVQSGFISFSNVYGNMPRANGWDALLNFWITALKNTEFLEKIILMGVVVLLALIARDIVRTMRSKQEAYARITAWRV